LNKKLRKLFKNPKAFWRDSKWNRLNRKIEFSKEHIVTREHIVTFENKLLTPDVLLKPLPSPFNIYYMIDQLKKYNADAIYIIPIKDHLKRVICVNKSHKKTFFMTFLNFTYNENISIKYKYQGKIKIPKSLNEFWSDISTLRHLDIRLDTLRSTERTRFWFRLEFWDEFEDYYLSPTANHISRKLWKSVATKHNIFTNTGNMIDYSDILRYSHESLINFDIDLVFTWVNSDDEDWQKLYYSYKPSTEEEESDTTSTSRFFSRDELKYALRSWEKYGSFVRNIYIVSNCKPPEWLDLSQKNIQWIYHEEIMPDEVLPTFNSHAIETSLHKIKGLSNYFIYSNDDIFLVKPTKSGDFYFSNGIAKLRLEPYGNVNGFATYGDPDYLNAARNANALLEKDFHKTTTQLHTHSPQSMRVDILEKMETQYPLDFKRTMSNKFRTYQDISVTSYMYQHYALLSGNALQTDIKTEFIQQNHNFSDKLQRIIRLKNKGKLDELPLSVCLNDGADSHLNEQWNTEIMKFLETFFPEKSRYEKC